MVHCCHGGVKTQVGQFFTVPYAVHAFFFGNAREHIDTEAVAVVKLARHDLGTLRHEAQREAAEPRGEVGLSQKLRVVDGLCLALYADAPEARQRVGNKAVAAVCTSVRPGDGSGELVSIGDLYQAAAVADAQIAAGLLSPAHNTAQVVPAAQTAPGPASADDIVGVTGDTAHVVAALALGAAISLAAGDDTKLRVAADSAHIAALAGHSAGTRAVLQDAFELIGPVNDRTDGDLLVSLRVQFVIDHHAPGDAAGIDVGADGARVDAFQQLAVVGGVDVLVGGVLNDGFRAEVSGIVDQAKHCMHHDQKLVVDAADILQELVGGVPALAVQHFQLIGDALQRIIQRVAAVAHGAAGAVKVQRVLAGEVIQRGGKLLQRGGGGLGAVAQRGNCAAQISCSGLRALRRAAERFCRGAQIVEHTAAVSGPAAGQDADGILYLLKAASGGVAVEGRAVIDVPQRVVHGVQAVGGVGDQPGNILLRKELLHVAEGSDAAVRDTVGQLPQLIREGARGGNQGLQSAAQILQRAVYVASGLIGVAIDDPAPLLLAHALGGHDGALQAVHAGFQLPGRRIQDGRGGR